MNLDHNLTSSLVCPMVVPATLAGELYLSQRVMLVGDSVSSRFAAPMGWSSWSSGATGLSPVTPSRWWQPALRLADGVESSVRQKRRVE